MRLVDLPCGPADCRPELVRVVVGERVQLLGRLVGARLVVEDAGLVELLALPQGRMLRPVRMGAAYELGLAVHPVLVNCDLVSRVCLRLGPAHVAFRVVVLPGRGSSVGASAEEVTVVGVRPPLHRRTVLLLTGQASLGEVGGHLGRAVVEDGGTLLLVGPVRVAHLLVYARGADSLWVAVPLEVAGGEPRAAAVQLLHVDPGRLATKKL
mmetsp:Transcript_63320/g.185126  ORF Transcript_63320/g.185126 Transcript_63320/m.185126 type:complete len:210 (-) Transcript_63320:470-1099(-)